MVKTDSMITFFPLCFCYLHVAQLVLTASNVCLAILIFTFWNRVAETPRFVVCGSVGVCNFAAFHLHGNSRSLLGTVLPGGHR